MSVTLDLPEDLLTSIFHVSPENMPRQVRIELACALYARDAITHAQAAELAELNRFELGEELAQRSIPRHYSAVDLATDLAYGRGQ